jgi:hypothetical protein
LDGLEAEAGAEKALRRGAARPHHGYAGLRRAGSKFIRGIDADDRILVFRPCFPRDAGRSWSEGRARGPAGRARFVFQGLGRRGGGTSGEMKARPAEAGPVF